MYPLFVYVAMVIVKVIPVEIPSHLQMNKTMSTSMVRVRGNAVLR
jgi:hypothetical protein